MFALTSGGTMSVLSIGERLPRRGGVWRAAVKTLAVATLPFAGVYDPPRRGLFDTGVSNILVMGDLSDDYLFIEPESLLTISPDRPTLWFATPLPILAPRRPYVPPTWGLGDEDE